MDETHQPGLAEVTIIEDSDADDRCDANAFAKSTLRTGDDVQYRVLGL